jgi:SAM-dependent methyltransferase
MPDPLPAMSKPFANISEAPILLYKLGLLLSGMRLGKSMVVLDFGAGTCWLSRLLNQMSCITISVDVSETSLEFGKRLFSISPIVGNYLKPPEFVVFDGEHINVKDDSVDRIVCFDTFHHVPNQNTILSEFFRVLKPGGIVGFSEPGMFHSQNVQSQMEMRNHGVLENDINLEEINSLATSIGFSDLRIKLQTDPFADLCLEEYRELINGFPNKSDEPKQSADPLFFIKRLFKHQVKIKQNSVSSSLSTRILNPLSPIMQNSTIFSFTKGNFIPDSRDHIGLRHEITIGVGQITVKSGDKSEFTIRVKNTGQNKWLIQNIQDIGVVNIGLHLLDSQYHLLNNDFARFRLNKELLPEEYIDVIINLVISKPGSYILGIDMVSEQISWFEPLGSSPAYIQVSVY